MRLDYEIVDVFTDRPFAGNRWPSCWAPTTSPRSSARRSPPSSDSPRRRSRPRRSTPAGSTPPGSSPPSRRSRSPGTPRSAPRRCCGPGAADRGRRAQVCGAGRVGVRFDGDVVELSATPRDLAGPLDPALTRDLLRLVGLAPSDLAGQAWVAGCGLTFVHLPVSEEAVVRAVPSGGGSAARRPDRRGRPGRGPAGRAERVRRRRRRPGALGALAGVRPGRGSARGPGDRVRRRRARDGAGRVRAAARGRPLRDQPGAGDGPALRAVRPRRGRRRGATRCHVAGRVQPVAVGQIAVPA